MQHIPALRTGLHQYTYIRLHHTPIRLQLYLILENIIRLACHHRKYILVYRVLLYIYKPTCSSYMKLICCCFSRRKDCMSVCLISDCRYGDKDVHECSKIKPHYCYKKDFEKKCCGTCARFFTGRNGKPHFL